MLVMRLKGFTYKAISIKAGISRQRVQQLLSPPPSIRAYVVAKFGGECNRCGVLVGQSGHIHHNGDNPETYNDIENLELLCLGCHSKEHNSLIVECVEKRESKKVSLNKVRVLRRELRLTQTAFAARLGVAPFTVRRWEKGVCLPSTMARRAIKEVFGLELK